MSDTLASILKQAEAHGILQRKVVKGKVTEYLPTHPGETSTANKGVQWIGHPSGDGWVEHPVSAEEFDYSLTVWDGKQMSVIPPKPVQQAAALGLELRRQFGRGGTEVGVARARDLSNGRAVSENTLTRMRSYFARHAVDAQADGWKDEASPSAGWIAWLLWGGDEGRDWVEGLLGEQKWLTAEKQHTGAMLALYPDTPPEFSLMDQDLEPTAPDELHVTMAYLGNAADLDEEDRGFLRRLCAQIASEFSPIQATLGGIGRFLNVEDDDTQAYYASVDSPDVEKLRARLVEVLGALGLIPENAHGFTPHMTLANVPVGKPAAGAGLQEEPVEFGKLSLSLGGEKEDFPFSLEGEKFSPGQARDAEGRWVGENAMVSSPTDHYREGPLYTVRSGQVLSPELLKEEGLILYAPALSSDLIVSPGQSSRSHASIIQGHLKKSGDEFDQYVKGRLELNSKDVLTLKVNSMVSGIGRDTAMSGEPDDINRKAERNLRKLARAMIGAGYPESMPVRWQMMGDQPDVRSELGAFKEKHQEVELSLRALAEKQNILLTYPDESKTHRFVWQQHFRGKSAHGDFRVESGDYLVGWTIPDQIPGAIAEPVETLAQATTAVNNPDLWKMDLKTGEIKPREIRGGTVRKGDLRALPKGVEIPEDWLNEQGVTDKPDPGEAIPVGATRNFPGVFKIVDKGTVEHGAKKPWLAEYWIRGDKWGTQRWLFRLLERDGQKYNPGQSRDASGRWSSGGFEPTTNLEERKTVLPGKISDVSQMSKADFNKLPKVYRGVTMRNVGTTEMVFVSNDPKLAATHGTVLEMRLAPGATIYPDPEIEGFHGKDLNGLESLNFGSAIVKNLDSLLPDNYELAKESVQSNKEVDHALQAEGWEEEAEEVKQDTLPPGVVEQQPRGETFWVFMQPDDQTPYVLGKEAIDKDWLPPKGVSALPKVIRERVPKELHYWEVSGQEALDRRAKLAEMDVRELGGSSAKQLGPWQPYRLIYRFFRGPIQVRFGASTKFHDLWLADGTHYVLDGDPLTNDRLAAYQDHDKPTVSTADGKRLSVLRIGSDPVELAPGQPANPTKDTPAFVQTVDEGEARVLDSQPEFTKLEFKGGKLKGAWYFRLESADSKIGEFGKSEGPAIKGEKGVRPLFGSPGGKRLLAKTIVDLIPPHKVYVEPFAGGAAVLFAKPPEMSEKEVLADADPDIAFAYRTVKGLSDAEIEKLNGMEWRIGKFDEVKDSAPDGKLGKLHKWLYLRKSSQGALSGNQNLGQPEGRDTHARNLPDLRDRLASVTVRSAKYHESLKEWDGKETFFYLDPPYPDTNLGAAKADLRWSDEDCATFASAVKKLKGKWLVSLQDNQTNRDLFKGYSIRTVSVPTVFNTGGGKGNDRRELLIANYPLPKRVRRKSMDEVEALQLVYTCSGCKGEFESETVLGNPLCPGCADKALTWRPYLLQRHNDHHDLRIGDDFTLRLSGTLLDNEPDKAEVSTESPTLQGADGQAVDALKVKLGDPIKLSDGEIQTLDKGQARYAKTQAGHQVEFKGGKLEGVYLFGPEGAHPIDDLEHIDVEWEPGQTEPAEPAEPEGEDGGFHPPFIDPDLLHPPHINPDLIHPLNPPPLIPQPALPPPGMWYMGNGEVAMGWKIAQPSTAEKDVVESEQEGAKVGKRIKTEKLSKLEELYQSLADAVKWLGDVIKWGKHDDAVPEPSMLDFFKGSDYGFTVKTVQGEPWLFTWSANAFKDREGEIFSTKALESWADRASEREDKGTYNFWHIPGSDFAVKKWVGVPGRFLVEAGPFTKDAKGQAAQKFFATYPDRHPTLAPEGWGCSVEYRYLPEERRKGVYQNVEITRTSVLPRFAAANTWTAVKEVTMALTDAQKKAAQELFGEDLAASILGEAEAKTKELEPNVAHKGEGEQTEPEAPEVPPEAEQAEQVESEDDKAKKKPKDGEGYPMPTEGEPYPKPTKAEKKSLDQFVKAIRGIAESVTDDSAGRTALLEVADNLSEENLKDMAAKLKKAGKAVGRPDQKSRLAALVEALAGDGVYPAPAKKEFDPADPEFIGSVAAEISKQFKLDTQPIGEALTATAAALKGLEDRLAALETQSGRKAATDLPRFVFGLVEQASKADSTIVPEGDKLLDQKPKEAAPAATDGSMAAHFFTKGK